MTSRGLVAGTQCERVEEQRTFGQMWLGCMTVKRNDLTWAYEQHWLENLSSWWLDRWWCGQQMWWTVGWVIDGQMRWQIVGRSSNSCDGLILYSTMQARPCKLWGLDSSNHSWLEPRDASWYLHIELVLIFSVGADRSAKIVVFHITITHCTWWFLSMNILLSFPFTSGVPCLSGWAIVLMHWWLINVVCAI